jgi:nucleoside-diphosphate-sugar epimerase
VKALVTGSAGFVGRHFARELHGRGWSVDGVDLANPDAPLDVRDLFRCSEVHYDLVIHCAAVVGGRLKIEGAPLDLAVDLAIDADLFAWALRTRPGRIVYFSSSAAYPVQLQGARFSRRLHESDIDLDDIASPDLTYGWAKLTGEMLASHAQDQGLPVQVFRPFSGYGNDQALDYPFPSFVQRAKERGPFTVWGDGTQTRDFVHIDDIVGGVFAAIDRDIAGPVNLATGEATSFDRLAHMAMAVIGREREIVHDLTKPVGVMHRVADVTKLREFYRPRVTLLEGIERALAGERRAA